jgi:hypothetical protein
MIPNSMILNQSIPHRYSATTPRAHPQCQAWFRKANRWVSFQELWRCSDLQ